MIYTPGMRGAPLQLPTKKEHRVITVPHDPRSVLKYDENEYALIWEVQNSINNETNEATKTGTGVTHTGSTFGPGPVTRCSQQSTPHTSHTSQSYQSETTKEPPKYFELDPQARTSNEK